MAIKFDQLLEALELENNKKLHESLSLKESKWDYNLSNGPALRKAIADENYFEVMKQLRKAWQELFDNGKIEDWDYEQGIEDLDDIQFVDDEDIEDALNYLLSDFYDLCDNLRIWVPLQESKNILKEDIESSNDELFYKAYDVYPEYMEPILADLGYTEDNCETLEDVPRDAKRKAFSLWLKEMRERAVWNDEMPSSVYDIIDLVDSSNLGESLNESMTKEELRAKKHIISYLNRDYPKVASLLNDFDFKLTEDPDTIGYVDLNTKHVVLNRNLSIDNAVKIILHPLRRKSFKQALKDPNFIQRMRDENKEIEKLLREKDGSLNESLNLNEYGELQGSDTIAYDKGWEHYESDDMPADGVWLVKSFETDEGDFEGEIQADSNGVYAAVYKSNGSQVFSKDDFDNIGQAVLTVERVVNDKYNHYYESLNEDLWDPAKIEFFNTMNRKPYFAILDVCTGLDEDGNPHDIPKEWVEEWFERFIKRVYG